MNITVSVTVLFHDKALSFISLSIFFIEKITIKVLLTIKTTSSMRPVINV